MDKTASRDLKPFLDQYDVRPSQVVPLTPDRFRVDSSQGNYEGRFISRSSAELRKAVTDYAAHHRFRDSQRFVLNLYDEPTVFVDADTVFYLTVHYPSHSLQLTPTDVELGVANLLRLKDAMEGAGDRLWKQLETPPVSRYGRWVEAFSGGQSWFEAESLMTREQNSPAGVKLWHDWLVRWADLAARAVERLRVAGYKDLAERARLRHEMAWNQYRLTNLLRLRNQTVATLQLSDPQFDNQLYDLATLCQEICLGGHADGVREVLRQYSAEKPLCPEEKQAVCAYAAYPHHAQAWLAQSRAGRFDRMNDPAWRKQAELQFSAADNLLKG